MQAYESSGICYKHRVFVVLITCILATGVSSCGKRALVSKQCALGPSQMEVFVYELDEHEQPNAQSVDGVIKEFRPGMIMALEEGQSIYLMCVEFTGKKEFNGNKAVIKWLKSEGGRGEFAVWNVADGARVFVTSEDDCLGFDISRDERWLSLCQGSQRIYLIDLNDPSKIREFIGLDQTPRRAVFSPEGKRLLVAYGLNGGRAEIFDTKSLKRLMILQRGPEGNMALAWHPRRNARGCRVRW